MTDDLKERLQYHANWGDKEAEEALARITDLEARLAAAEADRDFWQQDSATAWDKCEERRLQAVAAEAGEDALAEALRPFGFFSDEPNTTQQAWEIRYRDRFKDWIDFGDLESARAALAAHQKRRAAP